MIKSYKDFEVYQEEYALANEMEVLLDILKDLNYISFQTYEIYKERYEILGKRLNTLYNKWF